MSKTTLNKNLGKARNAKNDEFYTQLADIENELRYYKDQFRSKIVYCNCDDPFESNFFKYFASKFNELKLKKLIATSYDKSAIAGGLLPFDEMEGLKPAGKGPLKIEIREVPDANRDGAIDLDDVKYLLKHDRNTSTPLKSNGDFRSKECIELLKKADIVVTNPPFSLFRAYVEQLIKYGKKFLIIGNLNAITYKEIFNLIKKNKLWLGYNNGPKTYQVPDSYEQNNTFIGADGKKYAQMGNTGWFTNLDVSKRHEIMPLYKEYDPEKYPRYINYEAIEVSKLSEIPTDFEGAMGVPVTFLDKYNPKQFEILGSSRLLGKPMSEFAEKGSFVQGGVRFYLPNGDGTFRRLYDRIVIKLKKAKK